MYKTKLTIELVTPYKQNKHTQRTKDAILGISNGKKPTPDEVLAEWVEKVYEDDKGYYIPKEHLQGAIKRGMISPQPIVSNRIKMTIEKAKGSIFVQSDGYLYAPEKSELSTKPVQDIDIMPGDMKKLVAQIRPKFSAGLYADFEIFIAFDWLTLEAVKQGIIQAGICIGIGSNRPVYGRFAIKEFKKI